MPQSNPGPAQSQVPNLPLPVGTYQLIEELSVTMTPVAVATISTAEQSFGANGVSFVTAATGILPTDSILNVIPPATPLVGVSGFRVDAAVADKFYISFTNPTAGPLNPPSGVWKVVVGRKTAAFQQTPLTAIALGN